MRSKQLNCTNSSGQPRVNPRRILVYVFFVAVTALCHIFLYRAFFPNQWLGNTGLFATDIWPILAWGCAWFVAIGVALKMERGVLILIASLIALGPCFLPIRPNPESRFRAERQAYLKAAVGGGRYGDQFDVNVGGRKLIYWRWVSWGIDNSIGVIYDPKDRLMHGPRENFDSQSPDFRAFEAITHGHIGSSRRMGDGLYLVTHT